MNLDFTGLTRLALSPTILNVWGQAGTTGTQGFMRVSGSPSDGRSTGTAGDERASRAGNAAAAVDLERSVLATSPQMSPACPHPPLTGTANEINESPLSPFVPGGLDWNATDRGFDREAVEERAAIMEFDGQLAKTEAEAAAWALMTKSI